ncbi:sulfurtransferase [Prosthecochloris sp. GSB1]|uniref:rhodanese-like domain-containing protein n=1 Tax=Prosthecochloris sp. GSB1 TaxID=281093 RepID=UPI000B8CE025|nr:rhodanese-like domain-containing protein [Prosthecochloris sp. GSB1]ASQ91218.1 sulfurtransferase [Prosthecochloris sp. GSB1]
MFGNLFSGAGALEATAAMIERTWPLPTVTARELSAMLLKKTPVMLFDVRTREEYERSHIAEAELLEPGTGPDEFMRDYGGRVRGVTLVFYCSVGQRSSEMLARIRDRCLASGAVECYNLRGGIFRWYNEGFPVFDTKGETPDIHGYNALWGMMIEKRKKK